MVKSAACVLALCLFVPGALHAQDEVGSPSKRPRPVDGQTLHATGYTLPQGRIELGLLYMGVGVVDWLSIGLQPIPWVLAPALSGVSANFSVKLGVPLGRFLNVALEVNPLWLRISTDERYARALLLPITLATSLHPSRSQSYSLAARYASAEGKGTGSLASQEIAGVALTRLVQLMGQAQFQLTRGFAIYVQGSLQLWEQELRIEGQSQLDARTRVELDGAASSADQALPWSALAGVHLRWRSINFRIGAGYGNIFVPRLGLTTRRYEGVIPDLDFFVRF